MNTLSKYDLASILGYLWDAERHATNMLHLDEQNCRDVWMDAVRSDLNNARRRLLDAGLTDVTIEAPSDPFVPKLIPAAPATQTERM